MNHVLCDGGLCNRLNSLIFALILKRKFGHEWRASWPRNNWCGAPLQSLFTSALPVDERAIADYNAARAQYFGVLHDNQLGFPAERVVFHKALGSYDDYARLIEGARSDGLELVYYNNLLPSFVTDEDVRDALAQLSLNETVAARARDFVTTHGIDARTVGLHIRKTDFGDAVDDEALFQQVRSSPRRFFVCSDDAAVNRRFASLPNCVVVDKAAFPEKLEAEGAWQHWITDTDGRRYPYNINRSDASVIEALVDLLVLSQTEIVVTSGSTFLATARLFGRCGFFQPVEGAVTPPAPPAPAYVTRQDVQRLLERLQPHALMDDVLVRAGPEGDGGWTLPASAWRCDTLLAVGPERDCSLRQAYAAQGARVLVAEDVAAALRAAPDNGHAVLTVDADGAEWEALLDADPALLERCAVISMSLHGLEGLVNRGFLERAESGLRRLWHSHAVVHLRQRDGGGKVLFDKQPFPRVVELTWVRRRGTRLGQATAPSVFQRLVQAAQPPAEPRHGFELFPSLRQLRLPMPQGVLQIGASYGQELPDFLNNGIRVGVFVEPLPEPFEHLAGLCRQIPDYLPVRALCADRSGRQLDFHVASNGGQSSSILKPANHLEVFDFVKFPSTVQMTSTTVDDLMASLRAQSHGTLTDTLDLLYMDTQGAEFQILLGATKTLSQFKYLYFEVMRNEMYAGQTPFLTYCHFLDAMGFTLNDVYFLNPGQTGNALFVRKDLVAVHPA